MGFPSIDMISPLSRRNDICQIFDGTGPDQGFPVRLARGGGESRWSEDNVYLSHGTVKLGKADIVADGKADAAKGGFQGNDTPACLNGFFFGIAFSPQLQAEQMYFVIPCNLLTAVVVYQATVSHLVRPGRNQGY